MTKSEYEKKRDKAAKAHAKEQWGHLGHSGTRITQEDFKAGSDFGREYQRGVEDRLAEALILARSQYLEHNDCSGTWDLSESPSQLIEHSPDCLKCKMDKALEAYNKSKDVKP